MTHSLTVLVGNPKPRSRTRMVALRAAEVLRKGLAAEGTIVGEPQLVDLADWLPSLVVTAEHDVVTGSGLLLVGSPTYKGTFTGLLKLFVDLLPMHGLHGTVALPVMTAASPMHQHAVESYLRPLLIALGATVPVPGISILETQFAGVDSLLAAWSDRTVPVLAGALAACNCGSSAVAPRGGRVTPCVK